MVLMSDSLLLGFAIKQWDKLIRLGIVDFFDCVITSEEVGVDKPRIGVFNDVLQKLDVKAYEAVFVGDSENDILGAIDAKIISIRLKKGKYAKREFVKKADYEINTISEILDVLKELEKK